MKSQKSYLLLVLFAGLGAFTFSQFTINPSVTFAIGIAVSAFVLSFSTSPSLEPSSEDKPATTTLYVGNLPYKANEAHVRQLFGEAGEVFAVRLMKDKRTGKRRGFGFVVVASSDADQVVSSLNEKDYMQRTLKVRVANDPKHPESNELEQD